MPPLSNLATRDVETLVHPYTNLSRFRDTGPLIVERGQGVYVYDTDGKPYIEAMAGLWCTALGYGNEELVEAAAAQMRKLSFAHLFTGKSHDPAIELAEKLKEIAPVPISKVFFCNSGSEANDTQVKLVWYLNNALGRPSKKKIISRVKGYHGVTIVAASLTGLPANHRDFDLPLPGFLHTSCPHHYRFAQDGESEEQFATRLADELEALIVKEGPDTVAAFIAEPVMGAGGVIVPPKTYFEKIMKVCDEARRVHDLRRGDLRLRPARHGVRLRDAELQAAFDLDRQGAVVGLPADRRRDDSGERCIRRCSPRAKRSACSATASPMAAIRCPPRWRSRRSKFTPATASSQTAAARAPQFQARLAALNQHPLVGEARGLGLIGGVELVADKRDKRAFAPQHGVAAKAVQFAEAEGLIVRAVLGDVITLCPPLVISAAEIDDLFDRLSRALDKTLDWVNAARLAQT